MIQNEKAYYLKDLELALLLSIKGMTKLYGLRMSRLNAVDEKSVYQTLFELKKRNMIQICNQQIMVNPELDDVLDSIKNAEAMLLYRSKRKEHPDQCIYLGERAILIYAYGVEPGMNHIESICRDYLPERLMECGFCVEKVVDDRTLIEKSEIENAKLVKQAESLFEQEDDQIEMETWGNIVGYLRAICLRNMKCITQYLIINATLQDFLVRTDKEKSHIFLYSDENVLDMLRNDFGREVNR